METAATSYPKIGVGGILLRDDKVLLVLRSRPPEAGCWSLPGGRVEFMERVEDALTRELKEELGIDVEVESLVCVTNQILPAENVHWIAPAYRVRAVSGEPRNREPEKTAAVEWFSLSQLPENLTTTARSALSALLLAIQKR
jgi:ADP-ribose pyrophosphatase YjhB (NUDIX family)